LAMVYGKEKDEIVVEMMKIAGERNITRFTRDSKNLRDSEVVLLIGVKGPKSFGLNCGACGYQTCEAFEETEKKARVRFCRTNMSFQSS